MADHNEPCGCEESQLLHAAIREYMENNDDTGIRNVYKGAPPRISSVEKLMRVDMPLSIEDRRLILNYITKLETENECLVKARPPVTHLVEGIPVASSGEGRKLKQALRAEREKGAREIFEALKRESEDLYHDASFDAWIAGGKLLGK